MTDEEIDLKYAEFDTRIREAMSKADSYQLMMDAALDQVDAICKERDAWENTL